MNIDRTRVPVLATVTNTEPCLAFDTSPAGKRGNCVGPALTRRASVASHPARQMHAISAASLVTGLALALLAAQAAMDQVPPASALAVPLDGAAFPARVERIDDDWTVHFQTAEAPRAVAARDLQRWGEYADTCRLMQIVLADGSLLVAQLARIAEDKLAVDGETCGRLEIPLARARGLIVDPPPSAADRDRLLEQIATAQGVEDQLLLKNGDVLRGVLKTVQARGGTTEPGPLVTTFTVEGRDLLVPENKTLAIVFNPALTDPTAKPAFSCLAGFRDGSLLNVAQVSSATAFQRMALAGAVTLELDPELLRSDLVLLQPISQRVVYLSDLVPLGYKHIPYLETNWPLGRDRSVTGERLRHGGRTYAKGLGMHSASRAAYRLDGHWRRFEAELALDDSAGRQGSVVFRVFLGDVAESWKRAYESPIVRGGDPVLPISVELGNAQAIALIVDYADEGDVLDRAAWLNARWIK